MTEMQSPEKCPLVLVNISPPRAFLLLAALSGRRSASHWRTGVAGTWRRFEPYELFFTPRALRP